MGVRFRFVLVTIVATLATTDMLETGEVTDAAEAFAGWARDAAADQLGGAHLERRGTPGFVPRRRLAPSEWLDEVAARLGEKITSSVALLRRVRQILHRYGPEKVGSLVYPCPTLAAAPREARAELSRQFAAAVRTADVNVARLRTVASVDGGVDPFCRPVTDGPKKIPSFDARFAIVLDDGKLTTDAELVAGKAVATRLVRSLHNAGEVLIFTSRGTVVLPTGECDSDTNPLARLDDIIETDEEFDPVHALLAAADRIESPDRKFIYVGPNREWLYKIDLLNGLDSNETLIVDACYTGREPVTHGTPPRSECILIGSKNVCTGIEVETDGSPAATESAVLALLIPPDERAETAKASSLVWDPTFGDPLVPFVLTLNRFGFVTVDVHLADLIEDVAYFRPKDGRLRAFIVDQDGSTLAHSSRPSGSVRAALAKRTDISDFEAFDGFDQVKDGMLSRMIGTATVHDGRINATYDWKLVENTYVVCVVSDPNVSSQNRDRSAKRTVSQSIRELQYHRVDLLPPPDGETCRHFKRPSTIDRGTLYLSPSSFRSPFEHLKNANDGSASLKMLQSYMAYLKDDTRLLSNPGLKPEMRDEVGSLYPMLNYFKRRQARGARSEYVVRRYAATDGGALVSYPGSMLESDYEPTRSPWFKKAVKNPGLVILSPPRLDPGGAGYIVTVSYSPKNWADVEPATVVAMDVTAGFVFKAAEESSHLCSVPSVRCFIMDESGYLLSHPGLFDGRGSGPVERRHVTHKESLVANDMLNHREFVQKRLCKSFADGTLQRYYEFNTSIQNVLADSVHCGRYYVTAVPGTNAFFGMVNSTCNMGAFCPCSVVDRLCLNCKRMEQNECECPCECSVYEGGSCKPSSAPVPICDAQPEKNNNRNNYIYNMGTHLKSCYDFQCDSYKTELSCLGIVGCEWCHLDSDGESYLNSPFCSAQSSCFGGVLGAVTPYGEGSLGHVMQDDTMSSYSSVGPIAGCAVAVCLILAISAYCYRQNLNMDQPDDAYASPEGWPDPTVQMNHMPSEDDVNDDRTGNQDKLLLGNDLVPIPISPYRVVTGYRRPNTTGESDHGYSTMTPHDDSEHQAFALVEPFISADGGPSREPTDSPARMILGDPITVLPYGKNNVIAPVTVHRNMEAT